MLAFGILPRFVNERWLEYRKACTACWAVLGDVAGFRFRLTMRDLKKYPNTILVVQLL